MLFRSIGYDEVLEADSLNSKSTANIWYIGRFIDGFIFDTNIDEVKEIIYGEVEQKGKALSFETANPLSNDYILAWNYAMPTLRRGQLVSGAPFCSSSRENGWDAISSRTTVMIGMT